MYVYVEVRVYKYSKEPTFQTSHLLVKASSLN